MKTRSEKEIVKHLTQRGYKKGKINLASIFGLAGESAEVIQEFRKGSLFMHLDKFTKKLISKYSSKGMQMDVIKKQLRDKKLIVSPGSISIVQLDQEAMKEELSDTLYFVMALAHNLGTDIEELTEIQLSKINERGKKHQNMSHLNLDINGK